MAAIWTRINTLLLLLVLFALVGVVAMLASGVRGGPLDPTTSPQPTDSVRLPGTPITGQTTINSPGHYYLTRDIVVPGSQIAITIATSNVNLDLGGFTIDGNDVNPNWGIWISGVQTDVTIRNGTIRDFQFAIDGIDDDRVIIENINAVSNVRGLQVNDNGVISDCVVQGNTETGIFLTGLHSVVSHCVVQSNTGDGISVASEKNTVEFSVVTGNQAAEIRLVGPRNVVRDTVVGQQLGLRVEGTQNKILNTTCNGGGINDVSGGPTYLLNNFQC